MVSVRFGVLFLALLVLTAGVGGCVLDRDGRFSAGEGAGGNQGGGPTVGGGPSVGGSAQGGAGGGVDLPPGPVLSLSATIADDVEITWANPSDADLAGVLLVHRPGQEVSFAPQDGVVYDVGDQPMVNQEVIFADLGEMATLSPPVPGLRHHFAAWAWDAAGRYSPVRLTNAREDALGTQLGQIEVFLDGTVNVTQHPPNFPLSGSATYDAGSDTLEVSLFARNDTARVVFNLKALVGANNHGTISGASLLPPVGGKPYLYFGPEGLDVAAVKGDTLTLTEVDGTVDPVTLEVVFEDARWLVGHDRFLTARQLDSTLVLVDSSGSQRQAVIATTAPTGSLNVRGVEVARDGRKVFVGAKSTPWVHALDLVSLSATTGADLGAGGPGHVSGVVLSPEGDTLYAALTVGAHHWGTVGDTLETAAATTTLAVVALDPSTLAETDRAVVLLDDAAQRLTRTLAVSHDGTRAAVVVRHPLNSGIDAEIFFVDLTTLTVIDTDTTSVAVDPVVIPGAIRPDAVVWSEDDARVFVATSFNAEVVVIDTATFATSTLTPAGTLLERTSSLLVQNGFLYVARENIGVGPDGPPVSRFSTSTLAESAMASGLTQAHGVVGFPGRVFVFGNSEVAVFDTATHQRLDMDGDSGNGLTNIPVGDARSLANHFAAITPF